MGLIRVLLATTVVLHHMLWRLPICERLIPASIAVDTFFVISGFFQSLVLTEKYTPTRSRNWWWNFYVARYLRLYPTFLVMVFMSFAWWGISKLLWGGTWSNFLELWWHCDVPPWLSGLLMVPNLIMFGQDITSWFSLYPDGRIVTSFGQLPLDTPGNPRWLLYGLVVPPGWSLGMELWFYLLAPWLVHRSFRVITGVMVASLGLKIWLECVLNVNTHMVFPAQLCLYLTGVLAQQVSVRLSRHTLRQIGWIILPITLIGLTNRQLAAEIIPLPVIPFVLGLTIAPICTLSARWKWDRILSEITYPLYLCHSLMIVVTWKVSQALGNEPSAAWSEEKLVIVSMFVSVVCAVALYILVERRSEQYRRRFADQRGAESLAPKPSPQVQNLEPLACVTH